MQAINKTTSEENLETNQLDKQRKEKYFLNKKSNNNNNGSNILKSHKKSFYIYQTFVLLTHVKIKAKVVIKKLQLLAQTTYEMVKLKSVIQQFEPHDLAKNDQPNFSEILRSCI